MRSSAIGLVAALSAASLLAACGGQETSSADTAPAAAAPEKPAALTTEERLAAAPDINKGRELFGPCSVCHVISKDPGPTMVGPNLYGVIGAPAGTVDAKFNYTTFVKDSGVVWDDESLDKWFESPAKFIPRNRMAYPGEPNAANRRDLIAYLKVAAAPKSE